MVYSVNGYAIVGYDIVLVDIGHVRLKQRCSFGKLTQILRTLFGRILIVNKYRLLW